MDINQINNYAHHMENLGSGSRLCISRGSIVNRTFSFSLNRHREAAAVAIWFNRFIRLLRYNSQ